MRQGAVEREPPRLRPAGRLVAAASLAAPETTRPSHDKPPISRTLEDTMMRTMLSVVPAVLTIATTAQAQAPDKAPAETARVSLHRQG